jgi:hypothetical protein
MEEEKIRLVKCSAGRFCVGHCDHREPHQVKAGCNQDDYCLSEKKKAICKEVLKEVKYVQHIS